MAVVLSFARVLASACVPVGQVQRASACGIYVDQQPSVRPLESTRDNPFVPPLAEVCIVFSGAHATFDVCAPAMLTLGPVV